MRDTTDFIKKCEKIGITLSEKQISQFMTYYDLLVEWNSFMNLTAITEFNEVIDKHFIDSLAICEYVDFKNGDSLIDIGTGAGFPGIPLKIVFPELRITLLDSLNKRIKFLDTVIESLGLENVETIHGRAEDFAKQQSYREKYDIVISRAVANLATVSELCIPFAKEDKYFVSYKAEKCNEELEEAKKAISILGGKVEKQIEYKLPDTDMNRNLLLIKKVKPTPKKYPRKAGTPAKEPIK